MKVILILILITACSSRVAYCQKSNQEKVDSLLAELPKEKDDTNRIKLLNLIAGLYSTLNPGEGLKNAQKSSQLAEKAGWKPGIAGAEIEIGNYYYKTTNYPEALDHLNRALKINEEIVNKPGIASALVRIGNVIVSQGNYTKGLEIYFKALKMHEDIGNKKGIAATNTSIGKVFVMKKDKQKALEYFEKGMKVYEEMGNIEGVAACQRGIGGTYEHAREFGKAIEYYSKALFTFQKLGDKSQISGVLGNLGQVYSNIKQYELCIGYTLKALAISQEIGNKHSVAYQLRNLGYAYYFLAETNLVITQEEINKSKDLEMYVPVPTGRAERLNMAIRYMEQCANIANEIGELDLDRDCMGGLIDVYKLKGDYKKASDYTDAYWRLNDSLNSVDKKVEIAKLETEREASLKENQVKLNSVMAQNVKRERVFYLVGIALLAVVVLVVVRGFVAQKKANVVKAELLLQKDMLMKEIHHRVKNNLQVITALLDLQGYSLKDEQSKAAITESTTRVRAISLIHQQLYQDDNITVIEFSKFVNDLFNQVAGLYQRADTKVILENKIAERLFDIDTVVPLGLMLNELFTNSFKYAFTDDKQGTITIDLKDEKNHTFELSYRDNGPGLPTDFDVEKSRSLGIRMIKRLSRQIGGKLDYKLPDNTFYILFLDEDGRKNLD